MKKLLLFIPFILNTVCFPASSSNSYSLNRVDNLLSRTTIPLEKIQTFGTPYDNIEGEDIFLAIRGGDFSEIKEVVKRNPRVLGLKDEGGYYPYEYAQAIEDYYRYHYCKKLPTDEVKVRIYQSIFFGKPQLAATKTLNKRWADGKGQDIANFLFKEMSYFGKVKYAGASVKNAAKNLSLLLLYTGFIAVAVPTTIVASPFALAYEIFVKIIGQKK